MISHATGGGKYIRKASLNLRAVVWVSWHLTFGSINKSPTLYSSYIGASHGARVQPERTVYLVYSCACTQTLFGELFS